MKDGKKFVLAELDKTKHLISNLEFLPYQIVYLHVNSRLELTQIIPILKDSIDFIDHIRDTIWIETSISRQNDL